ncbi:MAG: DNA methyltransferase [Patescibacteria group bacterium]
MKYAFVLGRNHELSMAELGVVLGLKLEVLKNGSVAFFDGDLPGASAQKFLNTLGGTMEIIEVVERGVDFASLQIKIENLLKEKCSGVSGKCAFAVNLLPENKKSHVLKMLLPKIKKTLRAADISANFMNNNFQNASAVLVVKQGLVGRGTNIDIIEEGEGRVSLGFSVAMQDFEMYSKRDYEKPFRDAHVGMMPPKLAQIMINLAGTSGAPTSAIFDPFCGSGTILMEALLVGRNAIGCDHEARMAAGAEQNVAWLRTVFKISAESKIFHKNATAINKEDIGTQDFAVVTEPFLGPALSTWPAESFLKQVIKELTELYLNFFKNLAHVVPAKTQVVFIFPVWNNGRGTKIHLLDSLVDKIESLGYIKTAFVPLQKTSLFYDRPGQIVGREIVRFVKK